MPKASINTLKSKIKGKEKILLAARACFAKQGFVGASMQDIQEAAGFSRGNLYYHFKTKEEIVQIIISENLGRFCDRIDQIIKESKQADLAFAQIVTNLAAFSEEITKGPGKGMAFHVWSLSMIDESIRSTMLLYFERIRSALEVEIKLLQKQGKLPKSKKSRELSTALFGIVVPGFTVQSVFMDENSIDAKTYIECLMLLCSGKMK